MSTHEAAFKKAVDGETRWKSEQGKAKEERDNLGRETRNTQNGVLKHVVSCGGREGEGVNIAHSDDTLLRLPPGCNYLSAIYLLLNNKSATIVSL